MMGLILNNSKYVYSAHSTVKIVKMDRNALNAKDKVENTGTYVYVQVYPIIQYNELL